MNHKKVDITAALPLNDASTEPKNGEIFHAPRSLITTSQENEGRRTKTLYRAMQ